MGKRKSISKKTRFEVFKRDKFTCQYCGRSCPDVVLHVDHIKPVAHGGENNIMNYITACSDCNLGKGATELSDDTAIKKKKAQLDDLQERREQIELMYEWQMELAQLDAHSIDLIDEVIYSISGYRLSEWDRRDISNLIGKFGFNTVIESARKAFNTYNVTNLDGFDYAFSKIGGICYNKTHKTCSQCVYRMAMFENHTMRCGMTNEVHYSSYAESCDSYQSRYE